MSQLPRLPEDESERSDRPRVSAGLVIGIVVAFLVVALMVVLHLSGVLSSDLHG